VNASGDLETAVDESIATGVSGILLFYNELYNTTSSEVYLEYINSSSNWLIDYCQKNPATHGFYSGRMGAVYTLLKISEVTQQERYCQLALEIGSQFKNISSVEIQKYNIYNGLAGTTWGLLYLYTKTKENWLLDTIYEAIEILVKNIKSNGIGFYWDSFYAEGRSIGTKPLCGIPFGSSGIGLLFMHLGKISIMTKMSLIGQI
jgi:lantibiotic modifying enzyme